MVCHRTHSVLALTRSLPSMSFIACVFSTVSDWLPGCILSGRRQFGKGDAMTALKLNSLATVAGITALLAAQALGQNTMAPTLQQVVVKEKVHTADAVKRVIVVSLEDRKLALVEDG